MNQSSNNALPNGGRFMISHLIVLLLWIPFPMFLSCGGEMSLVTGFPENGEVVAERVETEAATFRVVRLAENLQNPWAVAWLPDGRMLVSERPGRLNLLDGERIVTLEGLPDIAAQGQGGLMDVAVAPDGEGGFWIYLTWSSPADGGTATALGRARLNGERLAGMETLYVQNRAYGPGRHYGSRIVFPGDGTLLISIGDRGQRSPSQDLADATGSTVRLNMDGSIPEDNPFSAHPGALPEIYTYGHRNPQGMVVDHRDGRIWLHEHGPRGGDALHILEPGSNYGWPAATYGSEYTTHRSIGIDPHEDPGIVDPVVYWVPTSIAPSGMTLYRGNAFPGWEGDLLIGALAQQHLRRVSVEGGAAIHQEELLRGVIGRIRDVRTGPDGLVYLLTDHASGGLYRLEPVD